MAQVNAISKSVAAVVREMKRLAALSPEHSVALEFYILSSQLAAEIGDVLRFEKKSSLVAFVGLGPTENSSGQFQGKEPISEKGSPHL